MAQEHKEEGELIRVREYITSREASELLGITYDAVIKAVNRGSIKAHKFGNGMWMLEKESVTKYQTTRYIGYGRPRSKKKETL